MPYPGGLWANKMGARRCSLCSINFPKHANFEFCPVCGEETRYFSNVAVDEEWLNMAVDKVKHWDGDVPVSPPDPPDNA
jgi:predicted amidophosphoribosyltransferase